MCRSKNDKPSLKSNPKHKQSEPQKSHNRGHGHKLNQVNADSSDCEDEHDAYSYVYKINSAKSSDEFVKLRFLNSKVGAMATVDTGAEVSVLPVRVYKQLYPKSVDSNGEIQGLDACSMKLTAFNLTNINVMGQIRLPVKHRDVMKNIKFIVTNIDMATVIGRNDAVDLHCVEFLCHNCDQCNDDDSICIKSLPTPDNCKNDLHYSEKCQNHAGAQANDCSMNYNKPANFPMHRIGTDLFEFNGKQFLVMVDHYSSYPWVRRLRNISSASCIDAMKSVFSEFGYPQHIHSNSGRQYSSQEFNSFVHEFNVKHTMFNAECYVGTMKRILKKCDNIYDALHAYRSTPLYNSRYSPFELLFNRRMKDNVISLSHFEPGLQKPTQVNSELGRQKPLQRNSELGPQKPPQGNFELGPQKPPQGNFEPVMLKPICELLPPQFIVFHSMQRKVKYPVLTINNTIIERVKQFNFLGIILHYTLKWQKHIDYISKKVSKAIGVMYRLKHIYPEAVLLIIYQSIINAHFTYGLLVWGSKINTNHPLHLLQKRALRIVKNTDYVAHSEPICKDLRLLKMPDMFRFALWKFYFKLMNNKLPPYFENMKPVLPRICDNYDIRRPSFHLPLIKHDFAEQLISYQLTTMLNENGSTRFSSKVFTHSFSGFSYYLKNVIIDRYIMNCNVINCISCERVANHQAHVNCN